MEGKVTIWYRVNSWGMKVYPVETIGETDKYLILTTKSCLKDHKNHREKKNTQWYNYFRTEGEALKHIHTRLSARIERAKRLLQEAEADLTNFATKYPGVK